MKLVNTLIETYRDEKILKPVFHMVFWIIYFAFNVARWGHYFGDYAYAFQSNLVEFPIHMILVYFNLYFLLKRLIPQNITLYVFCLALSVLVMSIVRIALTYEFVTTDIYRESTIEQDGLYNANYLIAVFIGELYVVGLTMAIKLTIDWVNSEKKSQELAQSNLETELSLLRSQMQPHFFFNTLNNLYSLTLEKSDQAPETVLKLSEMMSYVVYKGCNSQAPLINEIEHLHNYLNLERIRYDSRLSVNFNIDGKIADQKIPPLILITFLENAFKHGTSNTLGEISIDIDLKVEPGRISYKVQNDYHEESASNKKVSGIGIENTKRRLDLVYKNDYALHIQKNNGKFLVELSIPPL